MLLPRGVQFSPSLPGIVLLLPTPGPPAGHAELGLPRSGFPFSTVPGMEVSNIRAMLFGRAITSGCGDRKAILVVPLIINKRTLREGFPVSFCLEINRHTGWTLRLTETHE